MSKSIKVSDIKCTYVFKVQVKANTYIHMYTYHSFLIIGISVFFFFGRLHNEMIALHDCESVILVTTAFTRALHHMDL